MKNRYRLVQRGNRGGTFYAFDTRLKTRSSLKTSDPQAAQRIVNAMNEAHLLPAMNLHIARAYLIAGDERIKTRNCE